MEDKDGPLDFKDDDEYEWREVKEGEEENGEEKESEDEEDEERLVGRI